MITSSPTVGVYPPISVVKLPMKTKMPSELSGSLSVESVRLCRKKPYWLAPAAVRASVRWVITPWTS